MKFLIVGAGALGGYFGGRMLECGLDVTFLVRAGRAAQLRQDGLVIMSPKGDLTIPAPPILLKDELSGQAPFDVILVSCKAYDLASTMEDFAPAVGASTLIIPLLNGMRHLDALVARFGAPNVGGGLCMISAALDDKGVVHHFNDIHALLYGERDGTRSARIEAIEAAWSRINFAPSARTDIVHAMWEKWAMIASVAGITCLMRAALGDIVAAGGARIGLAIYEECAAIAAASGFAPRDDQRNRASTALQAAGSTITASMLKDIERGARTEGEHVFDDLLARGRAQGIEAPTLQIAATHVAAYEQRRAREQS
ncbi:2-dehydropantoate 2-reductase [soil metagenome]